MPAVNIENLKKPVAALYPPDVGLRCVELQIPDDDGYLWILAGFVGILGNSWSWRGTLADRIERARLWQVAYAATDWNQCMNCEQLTECITPLLADLKSSILRDMRYGNDSGVPPGTKPPDSQNSENQAGETNPECNKDILWAQCTQLVEYMVNLASAALNIAETATNDTEFLGALAGLPIVQEAGLAAAADYINMLLEGVAENFDAQINDVYKQDYACLFMQECCHDCEITIDRLYAAASKRMRTHFEDFPTAFTTVFDLWSYMSDQDIDGTIVADFIIMLGVGNLTLANAFFADVGTRPLKTLLLLAVNDANDDWLILCPDCPEEYTHTFPDADGYDDFTMLTFAGAATTNDGVKISGATNTTNDAVFINFDTAIDTELLSVEFDVEYDAPFVGQQFIFGNDDGMLQSFPIESASPQTFTWTGSVTGLKTYYVLGGVFGTTAAGRYIRVTGMRWTGFGVDPFV